MVWRPAVAAACATALAGAVTWTAATGRDEARPAAPTTISVGEPPPVGRGSAIRVVRHRYGRGASGVAVVRPDAAGPFPAVIFLHGWGYQRQSAYRRWIGHLARRGNAVIVPRYQTSLRADPARARSAMLRGLRTALRHVDVMAGTLIVAGHSAGAALAADYAATARAQRLPRPQAVFAVYPGRAIIGTRGIPAADPRRIPPDTRLLALAGARDIVVGQAPARELVQAATQIAPSRRRFVLIEDPAVNDHLAPLRSGRAARRAFWRPLDRLIERAR